MIKVPFSYTPPATAFGTVVTTVVAPGPSTLSPLAYNAMPGSNGYPNWWKDGWYTHITDLIVTCSTTANIIYVLRPLNFTAFLLGCAKNTTALAAAGSASSIADDPGVFSTNYRYRLPGQNWQPPGTANTNGPATADQVITSTNKIVSYQIADGTWKYDTIASGTFGSSLTLTTGTPNYTLGAINAGAPLFYYGAITAINPQAAPYVHLIRTPIISTQQVNLLAGWGGNASAVGGGGGASSGFGVGALNPGDPLIVYNPNATATTTVDYIGGYYYKY